MEALVQFYEGTNEARVFWSTTVWDIDPPPGQDLTTNKVTRIMNAFSFVPLGRWKKTDWGSERKFLCRR